MKKRQIIQAASKYALFGFMGLFFYNCNSSDSLETKKDSISKPETKQSGKDQFQSKIYIYQKGNFFVYVSIDTLKSNDSKLYYGNGQQELQTPKEYNASVYKQMSIVAENENYITVSSGCGTNCTFYAILPLNNDFKFEEYYFPLFLDQKQNLIVNANDDIDSLISITNLKSGKKMVLKGEHMCQTAILHSLIKEAKINGNKLYFSWFSGEDCESKIRHKEVLINDEVLR